jgi:hypothetical protein
MGTVNRLASAALVLLVGCSPTPKDSHPVFAKYIWPSPYSVPTSFAFLMEPAVQKELKLTDEQVKKLSDLWKKLKLPAEQVKKMRELIEENQKKVHDDAAMQRKSDELTKAVHEHLKVPEGVLTPDQEKRFYQLQRRVQGAVAFLLPENQSALGLSDEQKKKIQTIIEQEPESYPESYQGSNWQKTSASRQKKLENITAGLTNEQRKIWKDMIGEPPAAPRPGDEIYRPPGQSPNH